MAKLPKFSSNLLNIVSIIIVAIAVIVASFFFLQYRKSQALLKNPTAKAQMETKKLLEEVGKIYALPKGDPTIATVSDKTKLASQAFFASAQNGDKVLIFTDSKKAILYRPSTGQVIEVGPITIQDKESSGSAAQATETATVAVYNGTTRTGLTKSAGDKIALVKNFTVDERTNAAKKDYENTIVIDISGKNKVIAQTLAKMLSATVGDLPEGEKSPETDILVILGADYKE